MKAIKFAMKTIDQARRPIARIFGPLSSPRSLRAMKGSAFDRMPNAGLNLAVMSFNIRRGTAHDRRNHWTYRRYLVNEILNQYCPDVLGLQEALDFQVSEICTMLPGYEWVGLGNLGGNAGLHNTILYDARRFAISDEGTFWMSNTPHIPGSRGWGNIIPRICSWVRLLDRESQQAFYFYNTHLDHLSPRSRKNSVLSIIRCIEARTFPDPFILVGDFNARERSMPIGFLKGKNPMATKGNAKTLNPMPLIDTFRARYPKHRKTVTFHGFRRYGFRFRLDYIFVPSSVRVIDAEIIQRHWNRRYPSDHFPLFARVGLTAGFVSSDYPQATGE